MHSIRELWLSQAADKPLAGLRIGVVREYMDKVMMTLYCWSWVMTEWETTMCHFVSILDQNFLLLHSI